LAARRRAGGYHAVRIPFKATGRGGARAGPAVRDRATP